VRRLSLDLTLTPGVEVRRAHRVRPILSEFSLPKQPARTLTLALGDLERNRSIALLLELIVPPQAPGAYRLAKASVSGDLPARTLHQVAAQADAVYRVVAAGEPVGAPDPAVMHLAETASAFRLHTRALADAANGNVSGATQKLEAAATRLLALGETDLAGAVRAEAQQLQTHGHMSDKGAKELRYATRRLTQKLGAP
jgi:Ca-activated chloride channel family protein